LTFFSGTRIACVNVDDCCDAFEPKPKPSARNKMGLTTTSQVGI
jgi:hypothetical protein